MLPVGGYSFSHGLEYAVHEGLVDDAESALAWMTGIAERVLVHLDLPILARMRTALAAQDPDDFTCWNEYLLASRESAELLAEDQHLGAALTRLRSAWGLAPQALAAGAPCSFAASYAQICHAWHIDPGQAAAGYAWIWFEHQTAAAIKLVPLGHSDGQRLLLAVAATLDDLVNAASKLDDSELGAGAPGLALLSTAHEQQHGRLFQS